MPTVSVVIRAHSHAEFLTECLESLRCQTVTDWEAIVDDDAAPDTDAIESCIQSLNDPRVRLLKHKVNRGPAASLNSGFEDARADLVLVVDADDCIVPEYLRIVHSAIESEQGANCAYTDYQCFGDFDSAIHFYDLTTQHMLYDNCIPLSGALIRKSVWEEVGAFSESPVFRWGYEDYDFWLRAIRAGLKAVHVHEPLCHYRKHADSISVNGMRYNNHTLREAIYSRHRNLFDAYRARGMFLAKGYAVSAVAAARRREFGRSFYLLARGAGVCPRSHDIRQAARGVISLAVRAR